MIRPRIDAEHHGTSTLTYFNILRWTTLPYYDGYASLMRMSLYTNPTEERLIRALRDPIKWQLTSHD